VGILEAAQVKEREPSVVFYAGAKDLIFGRVKMIRQL
jgi:hypothetical protein